MPSVPSVDRTTTKPKVKPRPPAEFVLHNFRGTEVATDHGRLVIPASVTDMASYLEWLRSPGYPEKANTAWLNGIVWVEGRVEDMHGHNLVKCEITSVLRVFTRRPPTGYLLADRMRFVNTAAGVSREPDAMFLSYEAVETGRATRVTNDAGVVMEIHGTPDMVLEVVSESSEQKDEVTLFDLYWRAGVPEYWLVDVRAGLRFDIYRRKPDGYSAVRPRQGWRASATFGKAFRLSEVTDRLGNREWSLDMK